MTKKYAVLFSGGKDSCYSLFLAKKQKLDIKCLISILSENKESYMFHTPSINNVGKQAKAINLPIIIQKTKGEKETELNDLKTAIKKAKEKYKIQGIITGAIASEYQSSRIKKICDDLGLECYNPLWQKNQIELLKELVKNKFKIIIIGIFAYPFEKSLLGKEINSEFVNEMQKMQDKYKINPAGEGGEIETFVIDCPLFSKPLKIKSFNDFGEAHSWRRELKIY